VTSPRALAGAAFESHVASPRVADWVPSGAMTTTVRRARGCAFRVRFAERRALPLGITLAAPPEAGQNDAADCEA
jgi:hypothetical protein